MVRAVPSLLLLIVTALLLAPAPGTAVEPAPSPIRFREVAAEWGLDFRHHHGGSGERYMVETVVGGVVLFDYDGDGDEDVFFVDGGALPGYEGEEPRSRLFRNDGPAEGGLVPPRFVDVTDVSGLRVAAYGAGGVAGDYDGDGDPDLYVTAFGANQLFRNEGDGTFSDATAEAGVGDPSWSASATFFDPDRDGDLDLYVTNYVAFTLETHKVCTDGGVAGYCKPDAYPAVRDRFYRNRGPGAGGPTFEDATEAAGFGATDHAGLGVAAGDLDGDGWSDLYVANDADPNFLFRNRRDGTFEDVSLLSGTAYDDRGRAEGGMGVALGDVDGDGTQDVVVTNFEVESNALYRNTGGGLFVDGRFAAGIADPSLPMLGFGVTLADLDLDGDLDLAVANGHILDNAAEVNPRSRFAQPNQVLENRGGGKFRELAGTGFEEPVRVSRGMAAGDLDLDGDQDLVVVNSNERADAYENLAAGDAAGDTGGGGWLAVDLRAGGGNRFGIGARLELAPAGAAGSSQVREVRTGTSYLSQDALTVHFGLGAADAARLTVRWPDGEVQVIEGLPADRRVVVTR